MFQILENKITGEKKNMFWHVTLVTIRFSLLLCKNSQLVVCFKPSSDWPICNDAIILQANGWLFGYVFIKSMVLSDPPLSSSGTRRR